MQQHSGQHVLSAAFDKLFGVRTVSFHLGAAVSTIDLAREMSPAEIAAAEAEANRIVWEDRPVTIRFADAEEAARLPLRKEPARGGTLRLIDVEGFDLSACGGTHVARTGGIGVDRRRVVGAIQGRAASRVPLRRPRAGRLPNAARRDERERAAAVGAAGGAARRDRATAGGRQGSEARADRPAERSRAVPAPRSSPRPPSEILLKATAADGGRRCRLVARAIDADANGLKSLATAIAAKPGYLVVLVSASTPALVVIARSADVDVSAQQLLAKLTAQFGGRGGGRPRVGARRRT